jgi:hypothetical protein
MRTEVIWWDGFGSKMPEGAFNLAVEPQINEFNGRREVQLRWIAWCGESAGLAAV